MPGISRCFVVCDVLTTKNRENGGELGWNLAKSSGKKERWLAFFQLSLRHFPSSSSIESPPALCIFWA